MCKMGKIKMRKLNDLKVNEAFEQYVISKKARGVKDVTIRTITYHFKSMSKYLDMDRCFWELTQDDLVYDNHLLSLLDSGTGSLPPLLFENLDRTINQV